MKPLTKQRLVAFSLAFTLAACGGGDGTSENNSGNNGGNNGNPGQNSLSAVIQASLAGTALSQHAEVATASAINLDASSSYGSSALSYSWHLTKQPAGSNTSIGSANSVSTSFTPKVPGEYQIALTVTDSQSSHTATLDLVAINSVPVAIINGSATVETIIGQIQLDGSTSKAPAGSNDYLLRYQWRLISKPVSSTLTGIAESEATRSIARFSADAEGEYKVGLTVFYEGQQSEESFVTVQVAKPNERPVARISASSASGSFTRGEAITLDASESTSGSGQSMQYRWTLTSKPVGFSETNGTLQNANQKIATLIPSIPGTYYLALSVFDGTSINEQRNFKIDVPAPTGGANTPPVAVITTTAYQSGPQAELSVRWNLRSSGSYDIDEIGSRNLTHQWTLISAPKNYKLENLVEGKDYSFNSTSSFFVTHEYGDYEFELKVQDTAGAWSAPVRQTYTVKNGANRAPSPVLTLLSGINTTVGLNQTVTLSGANSTDPDGNRLQYQWTLVDQPDGSTAKLSSTSAEIISFTTDKAGIYLVSLDVTDEFGAVGKADLINNSSKSAIRIFAKERNHAPQVRLDLVTSSWWDSVSGSSQASVASPAFFIFDKEQPLLIGKQYIQNRSADVNNTSVRMDHWNGFYLKAGGYDPDQEAISYLWILSSGPANYTLEKPRAISCPTLTRNYETETLDTYYVRETQVREWGCDTTMVAPTRTGTYVFDMIATDGIEAANPIRIALEAATRDAYPTLLLEDLHTSISQSNTSSSVEKIEPAQVTFPVDFRQSSGFPIFPDNIIAGKANIIRTFQLTAFDRDYTITDLASANPENAGFTPRFEGLHNNQIIKKGETRQFTLVIDAPSNLSTNAPDIAKAINTMNFAFRIAEKDGWTFSYTPTVWSF